MILKSLPSLARASMLFLAFLGIGAGKERQALTIITSPVDVDTSAIVAGKLSQGEAGRISCQRERVSEQGPKNYTVSAGCSDTCLES